MKTSHAMFDPHEDSDIIFGPVKYFGVCWKHHVRTSLTYDYFIITDGTS